MEKFLFGGKHEETAFLNIVLHIRVVRYYLRMSKQAGFD
jgi:hypothetical protein